MNGDRTDNWFVFHLITDTGRTETEQVRITFCAWVLNYCAGGVHFLRMGLDSLTCQSHPSEGALQFRGGLIGALHRGARQARIH